MESITLPKTINLLKQVPTPNGKLNCYAVDILSDLDILSSNEIDIIGARAYCVGNGKFYIMNSNREWTEAVPVYNDVLQKLIRRKGIYTYTFDPDTYDGIKEVEFEFDPTLQDLNETITRTGTYTYRYDKVNYDGYNDFTITVTPTLQDLEETITRAGTYTYDYDSVNYDGYKTVTMTFNPTLQEFNETITRAGTYTYDYDSVNYDGYNDFTITVTPTLQTIEQEISEGGEYTITYDPENYDGIGTVNLLVTAAGNGDKVAVDENDDEPDYLANKLVSAEGSGIKITSSNGKLNIRFDMQDYEAEFLETIPFASIQSSFNPIYDGSRPVFIGSSIIPTNSFTFVVNQSKFTCYTDSGNMTNCRLMALKLNDDRSVSVIAYSRTFNSSARNYCKIESLCEWSNGEKIIAGKRYYFGIVGQNNDTNPIKMFGYQSWASQQINMTPYFNITIRDTSIRTNPQNATIAINNLYSNSASMIYVGVEH